MFSLSEFPSTLNIYITESSSYTHNIVTRLKLTETTKEHRMERNSHFPHAHVLFFPLALFGHTCYVNALYSPCLCAFPAFFLSKQVDPYLSLPPNYFHCFPQNRIFYLLVNLLFTNIYSQVILANIFTKIMIAKQ